MARVLRGRPVLRGAARRVVFFAAERAGVRAAARFTGFRAGIAFRAEAAFRVEAALRAGVLFRAGALRDVAFFAFLAFAPRSETQAGARPEDHPDVRLFFFGGIGA
ncbi:MAG: hypothetical protein ABR548_02370 [Actinomycetota bacterium]|nr:hypothetical protein [Actinomycetota bacterium]